MNLGEKIIALRKQKDISQSDLAREINVSRDAIGKYERGDMVPTIEKAKKIADVFGVSLDYLIKDKLVQEKEQQRFDDDIVWRVTEIQSLPDSEKEKVFSVIDALIRDYKTQQAYRIAR